MTLTGAMKTASSMAAQSGRRLRFLALLAGHCSLHCRHSRAKHWAADGTAKAAATLQ